MKKLICLVLIASVMLSLCACGSSSGYGVSEVVTLVEQAYSIGFRNDDDIYYYVTAALEVLSANGRVDELSRKWFGSRAVSFHANANALDKYGQPAPRTFIIGCDGNSFPMSYISNGQMWGFDIELAIAVTDLLGWNLQIQQIEKEDVYIELYSGNIDCAWGGVVLNEDELAAGKYTQYGPYIQNNIVIASRDSSNIWNTLKLSGRILAMPTTVEARTALESQPKIANRLKQITRLAGGTVECFEYLYQGKCDIILTDSTALMYYNSH